MNEIHHYRLANSPCLELPCLKPNELPPLSLEEKVGQLFMVHFQGDVPNEDARSLIQDVRVGGIIYYTWANGLSSFDQVLNLSSGLQKFTETNPNPIPLLIAVDQEGGRVTRLKVGFTQFPPNRTLANSSNTDLVQEAAYTIGKELKAAGISMNLAPVVDVDSNPKNPIIGDRSFGPNPEIVIECATKALEGYAQAGVIATLKHFPGHGDTHTDSHFDLPVIDKSLDELEKVELLPFAKLAGIAPAIMTAHLLVPALDPEHCSTFSQKTITYLRNTIGYKGAIITDSLAMQGALSQCEALEEAALKALNAGCDILLLGGKALTKEGTKELSVGDIKKIHAFLVQAVKDHRLSEERVDEAVKRIFALKNR